MANRATEIFFSKLPDSDINRFVLNHYKNTKLDLIKVDINGDESYVNIYFKTKGSKIVVYYCDKNEISFEMFNLKVDTSPQFKKYFKKDKLTKKLFHNVNDWKDLIEFYKLSVT